MVSLILADDEELEREYLKRYIGEHYKGIIELEYAAKDGAELLEQVLLIKPAIVLMDIRMPRMDGLEAARSIKEKLPETEIVILSAYGQFSYAKQAMKLGVRDFLLKPYLDEELEETLNKILANMDSRDMEEYVYDDIFETVSRSITWDMAFGRSGEEAITKRLLRLGIESHTFKCIIFYHEAIRELKSAGVEVIRRFFSYCSPYTILAHSFQKLVLYLFFDREVSNSEISLAIKKAREYIKEKRDGDVLCGVSGVYTSISDAREAFYRASEYIRDYILQNEAEYDGQWNAIRILNEYEDRLVFTISNADHSATEMYIKEMGKIIENMGREGVENELRRIVLGIVHKLNLKLGKRISTEHTIRLSKLCENETRKDPVELLMECTECILSGVGDGIVGGNYLIVTKAKDYIKAHYAEPLNQQLIASALGVSSGYLSKNFRIFEKDSFTDYLSRIRVEEAKKLMLDADLSVTDIAYRVGFSDSGYFGKCFKKMERISPSDYISMIRYKKIGMLPGNK